MIETKAANAIRSLSLMPCEDALRHAVSRLVALGAPRDLEAAVWLQDIVEQRGCEHLDCGINGDGMLHEAISVIVRG